jgi:hypothetical protein
VPSKSTNFQGALVTEVECDADLGTCPPGSQYPAKSGVHLEPLPQGLPTMGDPCAGVPANAWCAPGSSMGSTTRHGGRTGQKPGARVASGTAYRRATLAG